MTDELERAYEDGAAAWPALRLDRDDFARRVATLASDARDGAELYLAIAIERGVAGAAEAFERRYLAPVAALLGGRGARPSEIDEVAQQVRVRLAAPRADGTTPLVGYAGRGQLDGLVRVTAMRVFLTLRAKTSREVDDDGWLGTLVAPDLDGPGQVLAAAERHDVKLAIATALRGLAARERAILKMHFVNGLGIDPIAKMLGVHRATAARQLARMKQQLVDGVRAQLAQRWGDDDALSRVASQVDLSLERLFATSTSIVA